MMIGSDNLVDKEIVLCMVYPGSIAYTTYVPQALLGVVFELGEIPENFFEWPKMKKKFVHYV